MVRTAGMHAASDAVKFVPDLTEIPSFEESAKAVFMRTGGGGGGGDAAGAGADGGAAAAASAGGAEVGLSAETLEAARQLDAVIKNLTTNFSEGTDYFQLLVSVFQLSLLKPKGDAATDGGAAAGGAGAGAAGGDAAGGDGGKKKRRDKGEDGHLRNFFLMVPALTLSFIDNMRSAKDRMEKTVKSAEAFFCDDGFVMGIAYLLAILKQDRLFESLHWWEAVGRYHQAELTAYAADTAKLGKSKADADRRDELEFKAKRIMAERREFEALYFAFRGARTFFRQESEDDGEDAIASVV